MPRGLLEEMNKVLEDEHKARVRAEGRAQARQAARRG